MKLPVWKPHHTKIAEKDIASLDSEEIFVYAVVGEKRDTHISGHETERR
jgi:hypothetical protein